MKQYSVITGASQGLGKAFAEELARRGHNLILISLPNESLPEICSSLVDKHNIEAIPFEYDLAVVSNVSKVAALINEKYEVDLLINNAGLGGTKEFATIDTAYILQIIQLNIVNTTLMTHQLLPNLLRQPKAYILNVCSLAALVPIGYKTVYPASKAFIRHFSFGLREELKGTNVSVSIVNPGAMPTNAEVTKRIESQGKAARLTILPLNRITKMCIDGVLSRKRTIVLNRLSWAFMKFVPTALKTKLITNGIKKELNI